MSAEHSFERKVSGYCTDADCMMCIVWFSSFLPFFDKKLQGGGGLHP